jgi:hypothetical protein
MDVSTQKMAGCNAKMIIAFLNMHKKLFIIILIIVLLLAVIATALFFTGKQQKPNQKKGFSQTEISQIQGKTTPLTQTAGQIKSKVTSSPLRENGGDRTLEENKEFSITYVPKADMFFVFIYKEPAQQYKNFAQSWFISKGFNKKDLCALGIKFVYSMPNTTPEKRAALGINVPGC